jgi:alginate O-acetyltransferase complex protein AlgI
VIWGAAHGVAIGWETATRNSRTRVRNRLPKWLYNTTSLILTWAFLVVTYVLFNAYTLHKAGVMFNRMFTEFAPEVMLNWFVEYGRVALVLLLALVLIYTPTTWKTGLRSTFTKLPWPVQAVLGAVAIVVVYQSATTGLQPFIYLKF